MNIESQQEKLLIEVAEKCNYIIAYLKKYDLVTREYLSFLIVNAIPTFKNLELDEIKKFLSYLNTNILDSEKLREFSEKADNQIN